MSDPYAVVSVAGMRALEAAAITAGTSELELQERAGRAVADVVHGRLASTRGRVLVLVGAGNNGRDAAVAARYIAARGHAVAVWLWTRHGLSADELAQLAGMDVDIASLNGAEGMAGLRQALGIADVAIDGLLGVGSRGPMRPGLADVAATLNAARTARRALLVVAVDVPSGLDADGGAAPGVVVRADVTVTFGAIKAGLLRFPGAELAGEILVRPIGLPSEAVEGQPVRV
ncbi:MAG: NAD(P)H-hydrate epimerase, partial [Chloroflexota bacterium]|nr:NAD(P)H-hydrate epimerase [Chloroflexota bacterium]